MIDLILVLSAVMSAGSALIDKAVTRRASAWDCTVFGILFQGALLVPFAVLFVWPGWGPLLVLLAMGFVTGAGRILWYRALRAEALSRVAPLRRMQTLFALLLGLFVLGEGASLTAPEIAGACIMVAGGLILVSDKLGRSLKEFVHLNHAVFAVLGHTLSLALLKAVSRFLFVEEGVTVFTAYFTVKMGQVLLVLPTCGRPRRVDGISTLAASQALQMGGALLFYFALTRQSLVLSEAVASISPLLLIVGSRYLLGERDPHLRRRVLAGVVMMAGYLVTKGILG